jgi:hypothetical protein
MIKILHPSILTGLLLVVGLAACSVPSIQNQQAETETPLSTSSLTKTKAPVSISASTEVEASVPTASLMKTATLIPTATQVLLLATSTPKFAPFCELPVTGTPTPSACQLPIAEQTSLYCSKKNPYNIILINQGSSYEMLSGNVNCSEAGLNDGKRILVCTGPMATSFELKVCDPACALPSFQTTITTCPQDYKFDSLRGCCTQKPLQVDQNCVVLELQTKRCVIDCSAYTDQTTCDKNAEACEWDGEHDVCQQKP